MVGQVKGEVIKSPMVEAIVNEFKVTSGDPPTTALPNVYKEQVVQNMVKPAFFVWTLDVAQTREFGPYFRRTYQMQVRYETLDRNLEAYEDIDEVRNRLLECLTVIQVPIFNGRYDSENEPIEDKLPVHGTEMDSQVVEGVLQVFVTYSIRMKQVAEDGVPMATLEVIER